MEQRQTPLYRYVVVVFSFPLSMIKRLSLFAMFFFLPGGGYEFRMVKQKRFEQMTHMGFGGVALQKQLPEFEKRHEKQ
jgi:prophage maintenance system killer protein